MPLKILLKNCAFCCPACVLSSCFSVWFCRGRLYCSPSRAVLLPCWTCCCCDSLCSSAKVLWVFLSFFFFSHWGSAAHLHSFLVKNRLWVPEKCYCVGKELWNKGFHTVLKTAYLWDAVCSWWVLWHCRNRAQETDSLLQGWRTAPEVMEGNKQRKAPVEIRSTAGWERKLPAEHAMTKRS